MGYRKVKVIIIGGPTATGKTSLAIWLAKAIGGEIVNADSMQVYRNMDIGTAKPTSEQRSEVPHHMLDVVEPDQPFNASLYRSMALPTIEGIDRRGKVPIVVGGTGLYIKTLRGGLFSCPPADPELRKKLNWEYQQYGPQRMHARLAEIDPEAAARIHPNDRIRITRAIEIYQLTKKRPSELASQHGFRDRPFQDILFCLYVDRKTLYERINKRCIEMVDMGLVDETKALLDRGYSPQLKPMQAIGYRHMVKYITGELPLATALAQMQRDTRRYAKRQVTWFRAEKDFFLVGPEDRTRILEMAEEFVSEKSK